MNTFFAFVGKFVGYWVFWLVSCVLTGWALTTLWGWFIVPTFALPNLLYWQAIGLSLIASYFTATTGSHKNTPWTDIILWGLLKPVLFVFFGWLVLLIFR